MYEDEDLQEIHEDIIELNEDIGTLRRDLDNISASIEGSGENVTLNGTAEARFKKPPLPMGNSEQVQYSGKNKLYIEDGTYSSNGITVKIEKNKIILNGTATAYSGIIIPINAKLNANSNYVASVQNFSGTINDVSANMTNYILIRTNDTTLIEFKPKYTTSKTYTTTEEITATELRITTSQDVSFTNYTYEIQLEEGLTVTSFEPYVGGTASPNPDYPQEITNVTGDVEVKVQNKNLFNGSLFNSLTQNEDGTYKTNTAYTAADYVTMRLKPNTQYVISLRDVNYNLISGDFGIYVDDTYIGSTNNMYKFTSSSSEITNIKIAASGWATVGTVNRFIQLEENSTSTPYTPHKEQILPLTLGNIELCKIGDYQDYFYKASNKWYLHKEIGKVVYDGTETGASHYWYVQDENNHSYQITDTTIHLKESKKGLCNYFIINNSGDTPYLYPILQTGTSYCRFVTYNITGLTSTLEEWKTWLSTHNIIFYYPLETPTNTEITDTTLISQLEAINNAISYEEQTNVSSNTIALFNVKAFRNMNTSIESLQSRIELLNN